jgi:hypothetical protein
VGNFNILVLQRLFPPHSGTPDRSPPKWHPKLQRRTNPRSTSCHSRAAPSLSPSL